MNLPRFFGTTLTTIPATVPYLSADAELVACWRRELDGSQCFKVGIIWQGNPKNGCDSRRSIPIECLLARVPGVELFCLQVGHGTEQLGTIIGDFPITDLCSRLDKLGQGAFIVTAAAMSTLDLIISCDTAGAHLAGALGRPVWLPLSYAAEWRWLADRDDSPWYPSMRLYRQPTLGDWPAVFERMALDLGRIARKSS
jgi:hypothetical protein